MCSSDLNEIVGARRLLREQTKFIEDFAASRDRPRDDGLCAHVFFGVVRRNFFLGHGRRFFVGARGAGLRQILAQARAPTARQTSLRSDRTTM